MTPRTGVRAPAAEPLGMRSDHQESSRPGARPSFHVRLDNFEGPFDLLLQLIGQHRMDVTEVALHTVTDDFITHIRGLGDGIDLGVVTEFLVVAATLLDLKAARLLPDGEVEDNADIDLLEARDLLFARLLAYQAYQQVTVLFEELAGSALRRYPRAVSLEDRYLGLLPDVQIGMNAARFADMATAVFEPRVRPAVSLEHLHTSPESVALHTAAMRQLLGERGVATFAELIAGCTSTMQIVARFLGLLNLYRDADVVFDQSEPLGTLTVRWIGGEPGKVAGEHVSYGPPVDGAEEEYE